MPRDSHEINGPICTKPSVLSRIAANLLGAAQFISGLHMQAAAIGRTQERHGDEISYNISVRNSLTLTRDESLIKGSLKRDSRPHAAECVAVGGTDSVLFKFERA